MGEFYFSGLTVSRRPFFAASRRAGPSLRGTAGCGPANKKSLVNVIARVSSVQCAAIRDIRFHKLRIAFKFRKLRKCYKGVMRYMAGEMEDLGKFGIFARFFDSVWRILQKM